MLMTWEHCLEYAHLQFAPPELVDAENREVPMSTAAANSGGVSLLTTTRAGSASLCFKNHKAQTLGHLAPGCEDELSGLDPANKAAFSFNEGHTETKGYSGGIGLCQLREDPTIKTPTGRDTFPELQSINCVKESRRTASRVPNSRSPVDGSALAIGQRHDTH